VGIARLKGWTIEQCAAELMVLAIIDDPRRSLA